MRCSTRPDPAVADDQADSEEASSDEATSDEEADAGEEEADFPDEQAESLIQMKHDEDAVDDDETWVLVSVPGFL